MQVEFNERLKRLPPYLFIEIDRQKKRLIEAGVKIIDFGIGDPDLPTPDFVLAAMAENIKNPACHRYPLGRGKPVFRQTVADWFQKRFGVTLNPEKEVVGLIGSKEGIGHLPFAFLNPGNISLVPEPGYPVYANATILAGGEPHFLALREELGFLPDLDRIPPTVLNRTKILFLNYPHNPTGAVAPDDFWQRAINLAEKYGFIISSDAAYSEIYYEQPPKSLLQFPGGKEVGIEFHSFSKTFNMTGWRLGFACGEEKVISGLAQVKENLDSGVFEAIQMAGVAALNHPESTAFTNRMRGLYQKRLALLVAGLNDYGLAAKIPSGTFYLWTRLPESETAGGYASRLLEQFGILTTPGNGFGPHGEGYLRFSATISTEAIREAIARLKK